MTTGNNRVGTVENGCLNFGIVVMGISPIYPRSGICIRRKGKEYNNIETVIAVLVGSFVN